jgi:uncharacterized protein (DUF58 family)
MIQGNLVQRLVFSLFAFRKKVTDFLFERLTSQGRLLTLMLCCSLLFGIDIHQTLTLQIALISSSLLLSSWLLSLYWRPKLKLIRSLPSTCTVSSQTTYQIKIHNLSKKLQRNLLLQEKFVSAPAEESQHTMRARPYKAEQPTKKMGRFSFRAWLDNYLTRQGAVPELIRLPTLFGKSSLKITATLTPVRRGAIYFKQVVLLRTDPLGLFRAKIKYDLEDHVFALPKFYPITLLQRPEFSPDLRELSRSNDILNSSSEFKTLRKYQVGDPSRNIHWVSLAKTGKMMVKSFDQFVKRNTVLVVDTHFVGNETEYFETLVSVAASIAHSEMSYNTELDLLILNEKMVRVTTKTGTTSRLDVLTHLAKLVPAAQCNYEKLNDYLKQHGKSINRLALVTAITGKQRIYLQRIIANTGLPTLFISICKTKVANNEPFQKHVSIHPSRLAQDLKTIAYP